MKTCRPDRQRGMLLCLYMMICLFLCGCGESEPEVGSYVCAEILDSALPLVVQESRLVLESGGYARLDGPDAGGAASWTRDGGLIRLTVNRETLSGP